MSWPLPDRFQPGAPLVDIVSADTMQTICNILNSLVIEQVAGALTPIIVKTATPGQAMPWRIQIPAAGATLSDATPLADGTATAGDATAAARGNHVHPLGMPADPGEVADLGLASEGDTDNEDTFSSWTCGTYGIDFYVVTRIRLDNASSSSNLYAYFRRIRLSADGRVYYISTESRVLISGTTTST